MYKKLVVLLCSIIFLVTGCINQKTVDMTEEKKATDEIVETFTPEPEITSVYPSEFNKNDTLSFPGNFEITLTTSEFKTRVDPTNPGDFHTYYEVKSTETVYMHIAIEVKNLKGSGFFADEVASFKLIYDGKYEYTAFSAIEESGGGDFTYTNITFLQPLITRKIHYLIEVPLEVRDSGKDYKIVMYANGNEYEYIQEQGEGTVVQMADEKPLQTDYQLDTYKPLDAETINIISDYGEFTLKSATLTTKVTPTSPSGFYTYYQVKNPDNIYLDVVIEFKNLIQYIPRCSYRI